MPDSSSGVTIATGLAVAPLLAVSSVLMILAGAGAGASALSSDCGGAGTGQRIDNVTLDAEQMGNAQSIVSTTAGRHLPVLAAVIAVDTAYTESTLHNSSTHSDHDSEGLFQQRVSIYTKAVADDPVRSTNAFLDRLVRIAHWPGTPVGIDAQNVQHSAHPERYQPNAALAQQIVGQLWGTATAGTNSTSGAGSSPDAGGATICPGGGAASGGTPAGRIVGPTGDTIAGTTTIPAGFVISGSPKATLAVTYALKQLGKPYVWAASGPNAFDCSGLTMAAWAAAGVALPHFTGTQVHQGTPSPTNLSQAVAGDLVFIPGADGTPAHPGHVGMIAGYVERHNGRHLYLIQAPETGVPVELTEASEWSGQITDVRHIA